MKRARETENTSLIAAGQDGRLEGCLCNKGGKCHRSRHKEGNHCEITLKITKKSKHRVCKGCRSPKNRRPRPDTRGALALGGSENHHFDNALEFFFEKFSRETMSDDEGATSQDSGGESNSSDESPNDDDERGPFCLPCEETEY